MVPQYPQTKAWNMETIFKCFGLIMNWRRFLHIASLRTPLVGSGECMLVDHLVLKPYRSGKKSLLASVNLSLMSFKSSFPCLCFCLSERALPSSRRREKRRLQTYIERAVSVYTSPSTSLSSMHKTAFLTPLQSKVGILGTFPLIGDIN